MAVETIEELAKLIYEKAFWGNYNITLKEIEQILKDSSKKDERFYLFQRAFFSLEDPSVLWKFFSKEEIKDFISRINPNQRFKHLQDRIKIWRNLFLGENNRIPWLEWIDYDR